MGKPENPNFSLTLQHIPIYPMKMYWFCLQSVSSMLLYILVCYTLHTYHLSSGYGNDLWIDHPDTMLSIIKSFFDAVYRVMMIQIYKCGCSPLKIFHLFPNDQIVNLNPSFAALLHKIQPPAWRIVRNVFDSIYVKLSVSIHNREWIRCFWRVKWKFRKKIQADIH